MNQAALNLDDKYPQGFWAWYLKNAHIYRAFESMALQMAFSGRQRYSARTIIENIRWQSDLQDKEVTFKINGNNVPGLARLFMEMHGQRFPNFFELRPPVLTNDPQLTG